MHVCVEAGDQCWVPSSTALHLIKKNGLSLKAELNIVARLAGQEPMCLMSSPTPHTPELLKGKKQLFAWVLGGGIRTQILISPKYLDVSEP